VNNRRKYNINIGDISPHHPQIEVVSEHYETFAEDTKIRKRRFLIVKCHTCSQDFELCGDGCYRQSLGDFTKGTLPCECSSHPKRTERQWQVILRRAADKQGLLYKGYTNEWEGYSTKITVYCKKHDYEYSTCSAINFTRGRNCPKCAQDKRTESRLLPDKVFTDRWDALGAYPEGTTFKKVSSRLWELSCPYCVGEVFISDKSNLDVGKRPCNCVNGGGYSKYLSGYLYILKVDGKCNRFTGFGISNFFTKRLSNHVRSLNKEGLSVVESCDYFFEDCCIPREIESAIKSKFPLARQEIAGFKTEATHYDLFLDVRNFVEDYIENVAK
jgi:hypothetical protein